jgi:hypothetical protein
MSEVKVNKITPTTDCGTVTLGDSGDTVAIPAGVTLTSGGALQNSGTITNTGTITGVAITGTIDNQVNWQTTVKTTGFTATAGEGYFCDTTSAAFTVTLPASPSAGDLVGIKDYANTADTNNITIGRNGSNIEGVANDFLITVEGGSITLIYVDATKGWLSTAAAKASDITGPQFLTATGGTITCCGDYKIHTFTGPGTFCVSQLATAPANNEVSYIVVAGGGGGGKGGGGGGAGGFRESKSGVDCYSASPLEGATNITVTATAFPITVGGGGVGQTASPSSRGASGNNSVFSTVTSTGGGGAGSHDNVPGKTGGSGAGNGNGSAAGGESAKAGNTPPVSPPQGQPGGPTNSPNGPPAFGGSGGGGAGGAGGAGTPSAGGAGGAGATTSINGSPVTRSGGGGGSVFAGCNQGAGGSGGGGAGGPGGSPGAGTAGTTNTGGGGGGGGNGSVGNGANGGSGIVIIRYKFQ